MAPELFGSETPRIWTPALRPLTRRTSLGFEAVEFGADVLGVEPFPWQRWLLVHGLELHPDFEASSSEPLPRFDTVLSLAARQNGKTEIMKVLALWKIYLDHATGGKKTTVIGTAQDLSNSEKAWEEAYEAALDVEDLADEIVHVDKTNGKKALRLLGRRQYRVAAASRRGARGFTGDMVLLDELREHQSWESWGASTKTTLARPRSQVWCFSNAGDAASIVLWHLRAQAMATAEGCEPGEVEAFQGAATLVDDDLDDEDREVGTLGIFEWSAKPGCGKWDRAGWAQANGSLAHSITQRKIAGAARTDPEWVFRTEVLCQWRPTAAGGPFPDGSWDGGIDPLSDVAEESALAVCVDTSADGSMSFVAIAGHRSDGHVHAQVIERRAGMEWVLPWLTSDERPTRARWGAVTWQLNGAPVSALTDQLKDSDLPVMEWAGPDLARAHATTYELVRLPDPEQEEDRGKRRLFHLPQPALDVPASTAVTKPLGDGWALDRRKSPADCAPLVAVVGAVWALGRIKPQFRSVYEDHGLMVV